ncbi:hypothetical protein LV779_38885 [Streptomyces thinghirensis]|nr:hypothetical protein [Streptomyces thinghirensis]
MPDLRPRRRRPERVPPHAAAAADSVRAGLSCACPHPADRRRPCMTSSPRGTSPRPFYTAAPGRRADLLTARHGAHRCRRRRRRHRAATGARASSTTPTPSPSQIITATVAVLAVLVNGFRPPHRERLVSVRDRRGCPARQVVRARRVDRRFGDRRLLRGAAQADAFIGGDLYAVRRTVRAASGSSSGTCAARAWARVAAAAVVIGAFREAAEQEVTLEAVAQRLERALAREGTRRDGLDAFEGFTTIGRTRRTPARRRDRPHRQPRPSAAPRRCTPTAPLRPLPAWESALPPRHGRAGRVGPTALEEADFPVGPRCCCTPTDCLEARDARGEFYDPHVRLAGRVFRASDGACSTPRRGRTPALRGGMADDMWHCSPYDGPDRILINITGRDWTDPLRITTDELSGTRSGKGNTQARSTRPVFTDREAYGPGRIR